MSSIDHQAQPRRGRGRPRLDPSQPHKLSEGMRAKLKGVSSDPLAYSVEAFCVAHNLSRPSLHRLWAQGLGPKRLKSGKRVLITGRDAAEWRKAQLKGQGRALQFSKPGGLGVLNGIVA